MFSSLRVRETSACPSYDDLINRSRIGSPDNYIFQGTKLDISKSVLGSSVFTLSNTDRGLSMNYSLNDFSHLLSLSVFGDGSVLGKISPAHSSGLFFTSMAGGSSKYFDFGFTKAVKNISVSVKIINPNLEMNNILSGEQVKAYLKKLKEIPKHKIDVKSVGIKSTLFSGYSGLRNYKNSFDLNRSVSYGLEKVHSVLADGILSVSSLMQLRADLHIGHETVISLARVPESASKNKINSISQLMQRYTQEIATTCVISKAFETCRLLGIYHTSGTIGMIVEKAVDAAVTLHSEVSVDWKSAVKKTQPLLECIGATVGTTITGPETTTRVTAGTNGTVSACSDITVGDGAVLNLSTQISPSGPLVGIGFTFSE